MHSKRTFGCIRREGNVKQGRGEGIEYFASISFLIVEEASSECGLFKRDVREMTVEGILVFYLLR